jgi:hypothetical protein
VLAGRNRWSECRSVFTARKREARGKLMVVVTHRGDGATSGDGVDSALWRPISGEGGGDRR